MVSNNRDKIELLLFSLLMMLFREICKNFDEMAGRLGEIPDETKELVELQRLNIDQPY